MMIRLETGVTVASVAEDLAVGMLSVAEAVADLGADPDEHDLVRGAMAAIAESFNELDRAMLLNDWAAVSTAAVRVELVLRGLAAALGLPYVALLKSAATCKSDEVRLAAEVQAALQLAGLAPQA
jgi:hypothetical protein